MVIYPIHDQTFYLTVEHKRRLKEEYGIEPWTFSQKLGDAVFIPAGCPHHVRNLKSCIKVPHDFVSPENVGECFRLAEEFHKLPINHKSTRNKLVLEVKLMTIYAMENVVEKLEKALCPQVENIVPMEELDVAPSSSSMSVPPGFDLQEPVVEVHSTEQVTSKLNPQIQDMDAFTQRVEEGDLLDRLENILTGKAPFSFQPSSSHSEEVQRTSSVAVWLKDLITLLNTGPEHCSSNEESQRQIFLLLELLDNNASQVTGNARQIIQSARVTLFDVFETFPSLQQSIINHEHDQLLKKRDELVQRLEHTKDRNNKARSELDLIETEMKNLESRWDNLKKQKEQCLLKDQELKTESDKLIDDCKTVILSISSFRSAATSMQKLDESFRSVISSFEEIV